ncbi:SAM-dependent methyltransferase [Sphingomonas jinjuensis]|uniref:SAM-dependent methyltransferase n=1 Tax=Sphingomonas jinjuensis TaxID=535907 RepID=A0A840F8G3_9SPHN|nr:class I SAM-dependent methyltransferase [Sphingomonas jinjuensis]MBB4154009.1 SAM-dependent methyltransferase [Sphingomonas jinjuensis]
MTVTDEWTGIVGDVWAKEWRRTDRCFADLAQRLDAAIADVAPEEGRALDIGCGAGSTSLSLARAHPLLAITGVDVSPALIAVARSRSIDHPQVDWRVGDIAVDPLPRPMNLAVSRHGVMFFADPVAALARLRDVMTPGAPLVFSCFADPAANGFADPLVEAVIGTPTPARPPGYQPGPFGFADRDATAAMLAAAGWRDAGAEQVAFGYVAGEGDDAVADAAAFFTRIGPIARALRDLPDHGAARERLTAVLGDHVSGNRVVLPALAWIWRARA